MKSFFMYDKFNVTLCLEYIGTYFLSAPPPPREPLPFISKSDLILFGHILITNYNEMCSLKTTTLHILL